jgi:hypothetical protein
MWCVCQLHTGRESDGECTCRARAPKTPLPRCSVTAGASPENRMRFAQRGPCSANGDDTHTTCRATPLRSHPLAALPVPGRSVVSPARHVAGAVLGRVRSSSAVPSAGSLVAFVGLALVGRHRLARSPVSFTGFHSLAAIEFPNRPTNLRNLFRHEQ